MGYSTGRPGDLVVSTAKRTTPKCLAPSSQYTDCGSPGCCRNIELSSRTFLLGWMSSGCPVVTCVHSGMAPHEGHKLQWANIMLAPRWNDLHSMCWDPCLWVMLVTNVCWLLLTISLPNQEATTVAEVLVNEFVCWVPLEIHSDQGRYFESTTFADKLCTICSEWERPWLMNISVIGISIFPCSWCHIEL